MSANAPFYGLTPFEYHQRKKQKEQEIRDQISDKAAFYRSSAGGGLSTSAAGFKALGDAAEEIKALDGADLRTGAEKAQAQQQEMMQQAQNMMAAMMAPQEEEAIQVDGISSGFAEPEPSEKEFQDHTAVEVDIDTIDDLHDLSMSALRPEIIAKFVGCYGHDSAAGEGIGSYKFKDLLEANILRDQLADDVYRRAYDHMSESQPDILDKAAERADEVMQSTQQEVDSLVSYRNMINETLSSLDLQ